MSSTSTLASSAFPLVSTTIQELLLPAIPPVPLVMCWPTTAHRASGLEDSMAVNVSTPVRTAKSYKTTFAWPAKVPARHARALQLIAPLA